MNRKKRLGEDLFYTHLLIGYCPHILSNTDSQDVIEMTDAEALAFALQLPEVRALVEASRTSLSRMDKIDGGGGFNIYDSEKCRKELRGALAPFEGLDAQ